MSAHVKHIYLHCVNKKKKKKIEGPVMLRTVTFTKPKPLSKIHRRRRSRSLTQGLSPPVPLSSRPRRQRLSRGVRRPPRGRRGAAGSRRYGCRRRTGPSSGAAPTHLHQDASRLPPRLHEAGHGGCRPRP